MKSTMGYAAKRATIDAIAALATAQTGTGLALDGAQVAYSYPARDVTRKTIYAGGVRSVVSDMAAELGMVSSEVLTIGLYFRVIRPDADVRTAEVDVEAMADTVSTLMAADPDMGGAMTWMGVQSANGDYSLSPDGPEAVLSMQVMVGAVLT